MDVTAVAVLGFAIFVWGVLSARLERADLTAPVAFLALGAAVAGLGFTDTETVPAGLRTVAELTLVWVLFTDAAGVRVHDLRADAGRIVRLLAIGLPLSLLAGWGLALWLLPALGVWLALLVGAALAPTDAALGLPVVTNPAVPARIRRLITVESGLNDGIVTPVVMLAIAGVAAAAEAHSDPWIRDAAIELAVGVAVGVSIGYLGGRLLRAARGAGWVDEEFAGISVLALALVAYAGALVVHGNGFVAAFCGGLAFGGAAGRRGRAELVFVRQAGGLASLLVWFAFGVVAVTASLRGAGPMTLVYAALSLTVVRMVPVALSLAGAGLRWRTVLFVGWFGPRGLASLVFALIALDELGGVARDAAAVIAATVLCSVLAHGLTAEPLAARYGRAEAADQPPPGPLPASSGVEEDGSGVEGRR